MYMWLVYAPVSVLKIVFTLSAETYMYMYMDRIIFDEQALNFFLEKKASLHTVQIYGL